MLPATATVQDLLAQSSNGVGQCNTDFATAGTPLERYQYIVDFLASNGFYVVRSLMGVTRVYGKMMNYLCTGCGK